MLYAYIAEHSGERRADTYIKRIDRACKALATFPNRGTLHPEFAIGLRTIGFERRVTIAFIVLQDRVLIEGVFYGGQDIGAAFETE